VRIGVSGNVVSSRASANSASSSHNSLKGCRHASS
jgi:hypothetical protein